MSARQLPERDYFALKAATRDLLDGAGGVRRVAERGLTRLSGAATLSRYGSAEADCRDYFAPADVIADLEADVGRPVVTRALAAISGFAVVPLPEAMRGRGPWYRRLAEVARDAGAVIERLGDALADDGRVDAAEARALHLRKAVAKAMTDLAGLDLALAEIERGGEAV